MAKVKHTQLVAYMKGQIDSSVLYNSPGKTFSISRRYVYPTLTTNNHEKGAIMKNLAMVWAASDVDYRGDGALYAAAYYSENQELPDMGIPANNNFSLWIKAMFAWYESDPTHVDLSTVTVPDIIALDADVRTWARIVGMGWLIEVEGYAALTNDIQS